MVLLAITLLSGQVAHINPTEISAIVDARDADDPMKHYTAEVRCVVITTSDRQYTTREDCGSIEKRLAEMEKKP